MVDVLADDGDAAHLMKSSVLPNGTFHDLTPSEQIIALPEVKYRGTNDKEVEDLVRCTTKVKLTRCTSFGAPYDVDDGTLYVDVAAKAIQPSFVIGDVRVHRDEHKEHYARTEAQHNVHDSSDGPEFRFIELWNKSDYEANKADKGQDWSVDSAGEANLLAGHRVV